jgi:hypothetical protein
MTELIIAGAILIATSLITLCIHLAERPEHPAHKTPADCKAYEARHDSTQPRTLPDWDQIDNERLVRDTSELRALYENDYPDWKAAPEMRAGMLTMTGELERLALEGDTETINRIIEGWKADNL